MLYYKNLFIIIVASLFIVGCSGDGSFDEADFDEAPPSSGESIEGDHGLYSMANWMNAPHFWEQNPSLANITLPGTHDSGTSAYKDPCSVWAKTQDLTINEQLEIGVRFLDLRIGLYDGILKICHGSCGQANITLNQVLLGIRNFLINNNTECIVLCFDDEYNKGLPVINAIEGLLDNAVNQPFVYGQSKIPHLNEVRGKMIYWRRYKNMTGFGLKVGFVNPWGYVPLYTNAYLWSEDIYDCGDKKKRYYVTLALNSALFNAGEYTNTVPPTVIMFVTFTSYYSGTIPNPRKDAKSMNPFLENYIKNTQKKFLGWPIHLGIIASDFVTRDLVHKMICTNFFTFY